MARLWRYKREGQECGPVTGDDLKMLAKAERLLPTDLVCKDGTNHWFPARGIRGLFPRPGLLGRFVGWFGTTGFIIALLSLILVGGGVGFILYAIHNASMPAPTPPPVVHHHKQLLSALHEMRKLRDKLEGAHEGYGGHLDEIRHALHQAIKQTETALKGAGVNVDDIKDDPEADKKYAEHKHPDLDHAYEDVIEARTEVKNDSTLGDQL
ncbi:MAG TPA: DUF4339 domain-containing protein, partial [Gemmataceae bacterium]|nr:DUF4339 domain-containing protein [Gemmataceae bacterium]